MIDVMILSSTVTFVSEFYEARGDLLLLTINDIQISELQLICS